MCIHIYIYIYIHTYTYMCVYIQTYIHIYVYIYIYVWWIVICVIVYYKWLVRNHSLTRGCRTARRLHIVGGELVRSIDMYLWNTYLSSGHISHDDLCLATCATCAGGHCPKRQSCLAMLLSCATVAAVAVGICWYQSLPTLWLLGELLPCN